MILRVLSFVVLLSALPRLSLAEWIWIEGENAASTNIQPHPWYSGQIRKDQLSAGGFLSHFNSAQKGEASYHFTADASGNYRLWIRANPVQTVLKYSLNGELPVNVPTGNPVESVNLASDNKPDLRFIGWLDAGPVTLKSGKNILTFTMDSPNNHHGALDCFVLTNEPFLPAGILKPDQQAEAARQLAAANQGWVAWNPPEDNFRPSPIDLRSLNEKFAGENGWIAARGEHFVHSRNGQPVRFWAVNGMGTKEPSDFARSARMLAKYGVNLVRAHGSIFDGRTGELEAAAPIKHGQMIDALKAEGIYTLLSVYFPLWMTPEAGAGWREGYNSNKHPFALLYFDPEFQQLYRDWWREILTTRTPSGTQLLDEPALMGIELVNEDSLFFWTFNYDNVPDPQMRKLEKRFGDWSSSKYGSLDATLQAWNSTHKRDDIASGRLGFRGLYEMTTQRTKRDQDTAAFLFEVQESFYKDTVAYLRKLGFKGLITASNWTTADNTVLGPLEKLSYMPGDFIDRHGYFGSNHKGENASWSIRNGHTYSNVSALRFDPAEPGKPKTANNPVVDPMFNARPSMISETTWSRPNRYRGEAPPVLGLYGALQGTDAIVHFAFDSFRWGVKPGFFMQPWTLASPTQLGQFPATALIYRLGLVRPGEMAAELPLKIDDILALEGADFLRQASLDELRKADVKGETAKKAESDLDPLIHFVGRVNIPINEKGGASKIQDLSPFINHKEKTVTSSTSELKLDYGKGLLTVNAPAAQGAVGNLKEAGPIRLRELSLESPLETGQILAVSLDGKPLSTSSRILVQAMSEEKPTQFATEPTGEGVFRITNIGHDPWLIKELAGTLRLSRPDAGQLKVTALDLNGYPAKEIGTAASFALLPSHAYYLISK